MKVINFLLLLLGTWLSLGKRDAKDTSQTTMHWVHPKGERGDRRMEKVTGNGTNCPLPYLANKAQLAPTAASTYEQCKPPFRTYTRKEGVGWALTIIRPSFLCVSCPPSSLSPDSHSSNWPLAFSLPPSLYPPMFGDSPTLPKMGGCLFI